MPTGPPGFPGREIPFPIIRVRPGRRWAATTPEATAGRKRWGAEVQRVREEHPVAYGAGELGGMLVSPLGRVGAGREPPVRDVPAGRDDDRQSVTDVNVLAG